MAPEAALGGPIAFIEEGDIIDIDITNKKELLNAISNKPGYQLDLLSK